MKAHDLNSITITVSMPKEVVAQIDKAANKLHMSRSAYIRNCFLFNKMIDDSITPVIPSNK